MRNLLKMSEIFEYGTQYKLRKIMKICFQFRGSYGENKRNKIESILKVIREKLAKNAGDIYG